VSSEELHPRESRGESWPAGLLALLARLLDEAGEALEFFVADSLGFWVKESGDEFFAGTAEHGLEDLSEDGLAGLGGGDGGLENVARAVGRVGEDAFLLHDAEEGADGGIAGGGGEAALDFGGGALAGGEEDLDHLTLAAAEFLIPGGFGHVGRIVLEKQQEVKRLMIAREYHAETQKGAKEGREIFMP